MYTVGIIFCWMQCAMPTAFNLFVIASSLLHFVAIAHYVISLDTCRGELAREALRCCVEKLLEQAHLQDKLAPTGFGSGFCGFGIAADLGVADQGEK